MEMGTGAEPAAADAPDPLPGADLLAVGHRGLQEGAVEGLDSPAMADDDVDAAGAALPNPGDTRSVRQHRLTGRRGQVDAGVKMPTRAGRLDGLELEACAAKRLRLDGARDDFEWTDGA